VELSLPRGWETEAQAALADEDLLAGSQVRANPARTDDSLILVTPTRFLHVTRDAVRSWPVATTGVAEVQDYSKGQPGGITVVTVDTSGDVAVDEVHRFSAPNRDAAYGCDLVADELRRHTPPAITARLAELDWWDAKPAWPRAALGRIAGGTLPLDPGREVSVGLGRLGISLYDPKATGPFHQIPWPDVTGITVENADELKLRLGSTVVRAMRLLDFRKKSRGLRGRLGLEGFIGISTKSAELYVAAEASAVDLRKHWQSVLDRFAVDADEAELTGLSSAPPAADAEQRTSTAAAPERAAHDRSVVAELERLAALHHAGALTDAEYAAAKASILGHPR
jgi:hypothetical protein